MGESERALTTAAILLLQQFTLEVIAEDKKRGSCTLCGGVEAHVKGCLIEVASVLISFYPSEAEILPTRMNVALKEHHARMAKVVLASGQAVHQCNTLTCATAIATEYAATFHQSAEELEDGVTRDPEEAETVQQGEVEEDLREGQGVHQEDRPIDGATQEGA